MASFNKAFASARKAGKRTFSWEGKSYTTEMAKGPSKPTVKQRPAEKPASISKQKVTKQLGGKAPTEATMKKVAAKDTAASKVLARKDQAYLQGKKNLKALKKKPSASSLRSS